MLSIRITSLYGSQTSPVVLCMLNSVISTRITSLYGSQPLSVVFCIQNSDSSTRVTNLYGCQTSPVVLCKEYSVISTRKTCLYGSQPLSVFFACKTATFGAELQTSMGHSPNLWFFHAKQRLLETNNKALCVPDITCRFVHAKERDKTQKY